MNHPDMCPEARERLNSEYFSVPIDALRSKSLGVDLYLGYGNGSAVLYRKTGAAYSVSDCEKLTKKGISHFYIPLTQQREFQQAVTRQLADVYNDPGVGRGERVKIVRGACGQMIGRFMDDPAAPGVSATIGEMATRFSGWCREDAAKFSYLLDMSQHDYQTTSHMVNVGVGCGLLGTELLGKDDPLVRDLMLGGLVHDVGKSGVPLEILNKEGKLDDEEWAAIRQHPVAGAEKVRRQEGQNDVTVDMTLSHHERLDGKGYPSGLVEAKISLPARICGVVDIYDAMTTARPYRAAIPPRTVLARMREEVGTAIDGEVFAAWERVVERLLAEDPTRAVAEDPAVVAPAMSEMIPSVFLQELPDPTVEAREHIGEAVSIRRISGVVTTAELVQVQSGEVFVRSEARFVRGERVRLDGAGIEGKQAAYMSKRITTDGTMSCVFKIVMRFGRAA